MTAAVAGIGHNGGPPLKPRLWVPRFEPWRILRPLLMLDGQFYPGQRRQFGGGGDAPVIPSAWYGTEVYTDSPTSSTVETRNHSNVNIGEEHPSRIVVVNPIPCSWAYTVSVVSVTVNGVSASEIVPVFRHSNAGYMHCAVWAAVVPTGTSVTVQTVLSTSTVPNDHCSLITIPIYGATLSGPVTSTDTAGTIDLTATTAGRGIAIGFGSTNGNVSSVHTWTGADKLSQDTNASGSTVNSVSKRKSFTTLTSQAYQMSASLSPARQVGCIVAFAPLGA